MKTNVKTAKIINDDKKIGKNIIIPAIIAIVVVVMLIMSTTIISAGHTGVVSTFGKISTNVLQEGLHFKAPWQKVTMVDNRIVKLEVETEASSKDLQTVTTTLAINYRIDTKMSYSVIKNIGKSYEDVMVTPAANEVLKAVTAKYTAEECITTRSKVSSELVEELNNKLNEQGIYIEDVNIVNFSFSEAYTTAIEEKQVAEQQLKKAETEKQAKIVQAEAEAEATLTKAKAEAEANNLLNKSLTDKVIKYNAIEKWDGQLPKVAGSGSNIMDISDYLTGDKAKN